MWGSWRGTALRSFAQLSPSISKTSMSMDGDISSDLDAVILAWRSEIPYEKATPRERKAVDSDESTVNDPLPEPCRVISGSPTTTPYVASLASRSLTDVPPRLPSASQSARSRSLSPSKVVNIKTLRELQKEVVFTQQPLRKNTLPDDGQRIWARLRNKAVGGQGTLPRLLKDMIVELNGGDDIPEHQWTDHPCTSSTAALLDELESIKMIMHDSRECAYFVKHESAWNTQVHHPVMVLAIPSARRLPRGPVSIENITTATVVPSFQPPFKTDPSPRRRREQTQSSAGAKSMALQKLVDFAFVLRTDNLESDTLRCRVDALRVAQPKGEDMIGPSNAGSLTYFPVAVPIETKTGLRNSGEGHVQLGAWIAAWHHRMSHLLKNSTRGGAVPSPRKSRSLRCQ